MMIPLDDVQCGTVPDPHARHSRPIPTRTPHAGTRARCTRSWSARSSASRRGDYEKILDEIDEDLGYAAIYFTRAADLAAGRPAA